MKKIAILFLAFLLITAAFAACDGQSQQSGQDAQNQENQQVQEDDVNSETQEKEEAVNEKDNETEQEIQEPEQIKETEQENEPVEEKKDWITVVVAFDSHNETEYGGVINAFEGSGIKTETVSTQTGEAKGDNDGVIAIEKTISEVEDPGLGVVIIGGAKCMVLWKEQDLIDLVQQTNDNGDLVAAICAANGVLAVADIIDGKTACWANYPTLDGMMEEAGCTDSGKSVTIDGNLITGNGPPAAEEFGAAILDYVTNM